MRSAVCVYGEVKDISRWWEDTPYHSADVFVHSWDRHRHPTEPQTEITLEGVSAVRTAVDGLPSYEHVAERANALPRSGHLKTPGVVTDHASDFDSMRRVLQMRREHELDARQDYDVVILTRSDLRVSGTPIEAIAPNTIYGELGERLANRMTPMGSRVLIGRGKAMDLICYAFNALYSLRSGIFYKKESPDLDVLLHFYLRMHDVKLSASGLETKIVRDSDYGLWACEHLGGLRDYETL